MAQNQNAEPKDAVEAEDETVLIAARRRKLDFIRSEIGVEPYGHRVDGLCDLDTARSAFDEDAHERFAADDGDDRPHVLVSGRVMQHRDIGKLVFLSLRDATGDLHGGLRSPPSGSAARKAANEIVTDCNGS